jgi:predicted kinase
MLYVFGGLPGTGKSTLSARLARERKAVHLRIDTIEQALRDTGVPCVGPEGYQVAYALATHNLRLGLDVVADSVNPLHITRAAWREAAERAGAPHVEIEVICSDAGEHRARVESRSADIPGHQPPTWNEVSDREYEPWDGEHVIIDTAGQTPDQSTATLREMLL